MIKVHELTKIYKSKNRTNCTALDGVSFTLPDNGMVFVLGKSGSGKSTLLNLLGGLDSFEGGEIFFEDEQLSKFTKYDFYDYRCRHIGFVFQDFHLLEELTVAENIALVLDLESAEHGDLIPNALAKVGLEDYGSRYPRELSGGQKQRVAMARAIVKNPEVILCDEPTGNLDADNSHQILNLLKEFSKTKLIIIVSHNVPDAENYADRILELRDGKIIRDDVRRDGYSNKFDINEEGILTLPYNKTLSGEQIDNMVDGIRKGDVKKVVQNDDGFKKVGALEFRGRPYSRRNSGMSLKKRLELTRTMMRGKFSRFLVAAITTTLIVSCFSVFQSFLHYDINGSITRAMIANNEPVTAYLKTTPAGGTWDTARLFHMTQDDIDAFRNTSYGDQMYILYDNSLPAIGTANTIGGSKTWKNPRDNAKDFYLQETYGVLQCDLDLLKDIFGADIENRVVAGDLSCPNNGIIITDYVADSILQREDTYKYENYESLIGVYKDSSDKTRGVIDAIIDTGYREKYAGLKARMDELKDKKDTEGLDELRDSNEFLYFMEDVQLVLGIGYTFSKDYIADMSSSLDYTQVGSLPIAGFDVGEGEFQSSASVSVSDSLQAGQIIISNSLYKKVSSAEVTLDTELESPVDITVNIYSHDKREIGTLTFKVTKVTSGGSGITLSEADFLGARSLMVSPYAVYFKDVEASEELNALATERDFMVKNAENHRAAMLYRLIITFADLFRLFEAFLLAICVVYLCAFGSSVIQRHKYQVGIMKSLGGKTIQIASIFLAQPLIVGAMTIVLSIFGVWGATAAANAILLNSMQTHMELDIRMFDIIEFYPNLAAIDLVLVVILTMISALHNIKPINIIKAKE